MQLNPSHRRNMLSHYYEQRYRDNPREIEIRMSAADQNYSYRGESVQSGAVVRIDLNGYSDWANNRPIEQRVNLLRDFFSKVVDSLYKHDGIYFRDEGDCIVALFSSYFEIGIRSPYESAHKFCREVVRSAVDNSDELKAKAIVATGDIAFYQKLHEIQSGDWSAEGEPFVNAVRVEQAVESKSQVYYFADEYDDLFKRFASDVHCWKVEEGENRQIQGLRKQGGWVKLTTEEYSYYH